MLGWGTWAFAVKCGYGGSKNAPGDPLSPRSTPSRTHGLTAPYLIVMLSVVTPAGLLAQEPP